MVPLSVRTSTMSMYGLFVRVKRSRHRRSQKFVLGLTDNRGAIGVKGSMGRVSSNNLRGFDDIFVIPYFDYHPDVRYGPQCPSLSGLSAHEAWKEDWAKQEMPNQFLITDPTSCQPGFNLK